MSTLSDDTFDRRRPISTIDVGVRAETDAAVDLIKFMAIAQRLNVPFLPITWQERRDAIGRGGTSTISQAVVNEKTSLAFKRVSDQDKYYQPEDIVYQRLIQETAVLMNDHFRSRNYSVPQLQGICWEIVPAAVTQFPDGTDAETEPEDKVWPVLVFEATPNGDLRSFLKHPEGQALSVIRRLELCFDFCQTIEDMHRYGLIHGDIKPQNLLVFPSAQEDSEEGLEKDEGQEKDREQHYSLKVIDFGYSSQWSAGTEYVIIPRSWPWYAPEHESCDRFTPDEARRTDAYSLGMTCLWVLFERYFSQREPLPLSLSWANQYFIDSEDGEPDWRILDNLKHDNKLVEIAVELVLLERELNDQTQQKLVELFRNTLSEDASQRTNDLALLSFVEYSEYIGESPSQMERKRAEALIPTDAKLALWTSIQGLYQADYRVRRTIRRCLERELFTLDQSEEFQRLAFNLALCYRIGFGGPRKDVKSRELLQQTGQHPHSLDATLAKLHEIGHFTTESERYGDLYRSLEKPDLASDLQLTDSSLEHGKVEEAVEILREEIKLIEHFVGTINPLWLFHAQKLIFFYRTLQNSQASSFVFEQDLQELESRLSKTRRIINDEDERIMKSTSNDKGKRERINRLARWWVTRNGHRVVDDIELSLQKLEERPWLAENGSSTIGALMYELEMCPEKAQHKNMCCRKAEANGLHLKALIEKSEGKKTTKETTVEELREQIKILTMSTTMIDELTHFKETVMATPGDLKQRKLAVTRHQALTYKMASDWTSAEELEVRVLSSLRNRFAFDHPDAINSMINLGRTYINLGRFLEALDLFLELNEKLRNDKGDDDEATLESMKILSGVYKLLARVAEAREWSNRAEEMRRRKYDAQQDLPAGSKPSVVQDSAEDSLLNSGKPTSLKIIGGLIDESNIEAELDDSTYELDDTSTTKPKDFALVLVQNAVLIPGWEQRSTEDGQWHWTEVSTGRSFNRPPLLNAMYLVPAGWEHRVDAHGYVYWVNHILRKRRRVPPAYLPRGWKAQRDANNRAFWIDTITNVQTYERPWRWPAGWEARADREGRPYYLDHSTRTKRWRLPLTMDVSYDLPYDYEMRYDDGGRVFWTQPEDFVLTCLENDDVPESEPHDFEPPPGPVKHRYAR